MRIFVQHRLGRHDLTVLAESARGRLLIDPGLLQRVQFAIGREPFQRGDFAPDRGHRQDAGADRGTVDDYRTRAALAKTASKLGPLEVEVIAEDIQQWRVRFDIQLV